MRRRKRLKRPANERGVSMKGARRIVVLLSGGIDSSTVCLKLRAKGVELLPHFIFYGQRAAKGEWAAARAVARRLELPAPTSSDLTSFGASLDFPLMRGSRQGKKASYVERTRESFVPHRNLLLATCAALYAAQRGAGAVALGIVGGTAVGYGDVTPRFARRLEALLRLSADVRLLAPFAAKTKDDVVRFGWERGFDYGITYSCHRQSGLHCGQCSGCIERDYALASYPSPTPTRYASPVVWIS
jgi:7-cyano-7-deazaguanine synthase